MAVTLDSVHIDVGEGFNLILGQSHFIKTIEDLAELCVAAGSNITFGAAFCEASGPCLVRAEGNDQECVDKATAYAKLVGAGHSFCIVLGKDTYPINVLDRVKFCQEVCSIFCATANPIDVIVAQTDQGRGILGVVDGFSPKGVESENDKSLRKALLRKIGYKY
jgi:uncharacterized protein